MNAPYVSLITHWFTNVNLDGNPLLIPYLGAALVQSYRSLFHITQLWRTPEWSVKQILFCGPHSTRHITWSKIQQGHLNSPIIEGDAAGCTIPAMCLSSEQVWGPVIWETISVFKVRSHVQKTELNATRMTFKAQSPTDIAIPRNHPLQDHNQLTSSPLPT